MSKYIYCPSPLFLYAKSSKFRGRGYPVTGYFCMRWAAAIFKPLPLSRNWKVRMVIIRTEEYSCQGFGDPEMIDRSFTGRLPVEEPMITKLSLNTCQLHKNHTSKISSWVYSADIISKQLTMLTTSCSWEHLNAIWYALLLNLLIAYTSVTPAKLYPNYFLICCHQAKIIFVVSFDIKGTCQVELGWYTVYLYALELVGSSFWSHCLITTDYPPRQSE